MIPVIQRAVILPAIERLRFEPISKCLRELNRTQWYSREQLRALQWEKLRILIEHCYRNVPFYRRRFDEIGVRPGDIRNLEDFAKLPPLTKDEVRFQRTDLSDPTTRRRVEQCRSGGTLGIPLILVRDSLASAYIRAARARGLGWFGIRMGDKQVRSMGRPSRSRSGPAGAPEGFPAQSDTVVTLRDHEGNRALPFRGYEALWGAVCLLLSLRDVPDMPVHERDGTRRPRAPD